MTVMILRIGSLPGACPQSGRAARPAAVSIATGYTMVGLGGIILIGAVIPMLEAGFLPLLPGLGLVAIGLGLGFSHAIATLRAVVREALHGERTIQKKEADKSPSSSEIAHPA
ncbi:hypothetical protein [Roseobacter sp. SK209-2-6]|uniref:hypothetical protein n=1 Tax=Roseobacter sp. SK209-2-6 TaxID=388739 RepID=UPI001E5FCC5D|nr:hypothetical protein [Roseobacter sp. SK209-2-6]